MANHRAGCFVSIEVLGDALFILITLLLFSLKISLYKFPTIYIFILQNGAYVAASASSSCKAALRVPCSGIVIEKWVIHCVA
jgi:hypothetical protein